MRSGRSILELRMIHEMYICPLNFTVCTMFVSFSFFSGVIEDPEVGCDDDFDFTGRGGGVVLRFYGKKFCTRMMMIANADHG